jgi:hypothetical protein
VVLRYRSHLESRQLAPGTVNLRLGAVRRLRPPQRRFGGWHSFLIAAFCLLARPLVILSKWDER